MTDLHDRFRSLDRVPAPDLWTEVQHRAAEPPATRGWGFPHSNRFAPIALAGAAVILILVAVGVLVRPPNVGPPLPEPTATEGPIAPEPSSPDAAGAIAYTSEPGLSSLQLLILGEALVQLAPSSIVGNEVACPSFSPDGTMLAFGMPGGTIVVVPIDDQGAAGEGARLDGGASETHHCAAWAPDSSAVAFLDGSALVILPLSGEPERIEGWDTTASDDPFAIDYPADRAVQWSPDGSFIAVARPSGTWLIPTDGAAPRRLHATPSYSVSWSPDASQLVVGAGGPQAVVIRAADGETLAMLPTGSGPPMWSPVEDRIAFSDEDEALVVVRPDGTDGLVIDSYGYLPTWSSNGRQLIYMKDTTSASGGLTWPLMMANADGSGAPMAIVDSVATPGALTFPAAEQFSWQPVGN